MPEGFVLPGVPMPVFWVFVGLAIIIQGVSKSGFAGGAGILALPLMMLVMPVHLVAATLLPLLILCDMNAIYHHRRNVEWRPLLQIYIPGLLGILAGAWVWWRIGQEGVQNYEQLIKRFVGVIAIIFAFYIVGKESAMAWAERYRPGPRMGAAAGIAAGFCSTIAHAAGPIVSLYIFAQHLGKTLFVGTVAWTFTLINLTKLPFYVYVGLIRQDTLYFGLFVVWLIPIGSYLGKWLHHRVSEARFNRIILVLTVLAAIQLLFDINVIHIALDLLVGEAVAT